VATLAHVHMIEYVLPTHALGILAVGGGLFALRWLQLHHTGSRRFETAYWPRNRLLQTLPGLLLAIPAFDMSQIVGMASILKSRILSSLIIATVRIVFYSMLNFIGLLSSDWFALT